LLANDVSKIPTDWSPDGRFLLFMTGAGNPDLWVLPLFGERKPFPLLATPFVEVLARFSPDGRWVAYQSNESGQDEVYVVPFPGSNGTGTMAQGSNMRGGKWQVSSGGGAGPLWRRDGKEIFYFNFNTGTGMAASVDGRGEAFSVGRAEPLFSIRLGQGQQLGPSYGVASDGQRFLVPLAEDIRRDAAQQPVTVVVDWLSALRR
jgi:hypothetical protein